MAVWMVPVSAWAQEAEDLLGAPPGQPVEMAELELDSLLELEVTAATRQPVKISDAPSTASAVTRDQILDYGWRSANDVLFTLPGFFPSQDWERRLPGFRGDRERWNANQLLVTMDGMSHNDVETGAAPTWETTPLFFARQVDVVRGPASAVYGSNATHGVVGVETVDVADIGDGGAQARLRAGPRSQTIDAVAGQKGAWAEAVVGVSFHATGGDEYLDTDDSYRMDDSGAPVRFMTQDERSGSYLWLKMKPTASPVRGLTLSFHRQTDDWEMSHGWTGWATDGEGYVRQTRTIIDATYRRSWRRLTLQTSAQHHGLKGSYSAHYYPAGAFDDFYPDGVVENGRYGIRTLFAGQQAELALGRGSNLFGGVEYTMLRYPGDDYHTANAQLVDPDGEWPQLDGLVAQGSLYEPITGRPVQRVGVYGQWVSGALLGERLELTAGARYDDLFYRYQDLEAAGRPVLSDSKREFSPRLGLVVRPADALRLKLMAGRAFRTPTIGELFASNSWTGSSNAKELDPETTLTYEAAVDWAPAPPLRLRANAFFIDYRSAIAYTVDQALQKNIFSDRKVGSEVELLGEKKIGRLSLDGFASYSYVRLVDETVLDDALSDADVLVWAPSHLVKLGLRAGTERYGLTATAHYQGKTRRRSSDRVDAMWNTLRPHDVPGWLTASASAWVRPWRGVKLGLEGSNLFGSRGGIIQPGAHSFDYRVAPRELLGVLELDL
jgi:iron complex outermembrane receptor protein